MISCFRETTFCEERTRAQEPKQSKNNNNNHDSDSIISSVIGDLEQIRD